MKLEQYGKGKLVRDEIAMAKKKCGICGTDIGLGDQHKLKDGAACQECMKKIGMKNEFWTLSFTVGQIAQAVAGEFELARPQVFPCQKSAFVVDSMNKVMYKGVPLLYVMLTDEIPIESVVGYTYVEDDKKYGVGHVVGTAAVGGMLFGGVGAVVGSVIGSNPKRKITHIGVEITYETGGRCELVQANIYKGSPIKASGFIYNGYLETAKLLMGQIDLLMKKAATVAEQQRDVTVRTVSNADEIRKYKELLDEGIITQEEFAVKKKELLGISESIAPERKPEHVEEPENEGKMEDVVQNRSIILKGTKDKVKAIKAYRELAGFEKGIREAKRLIDQIPAVIFEGLSEKQADEHIQTFLRIDPTAELECNVSGQPYDSGGSVPIAPDGEPEHVEEQKYQEEPVIKEKVQENKATSEMQREILDAAEIISRLEEKIFDKLLKKSIYHEYFHPVSDMKPEEENQYKKIPSLYTTLSSEEDILFFYDNTMFRSMKEGFLITTAGIHFRSERLDTGYVPYDQIYSVTEKDIKLFPNLIINDRYTIPMGMLSACSEEVIHMIQVLMSGQAI